MTHCKNRSLYHQLEMTHFFKINTICPWQRLQRLFFTFCSSCHFTALLLCAVLACGSSSASKYLVFYHTYKKATALALGIKTMFML